MKINLRKEYQPHNDDGGESLSIEATPDHPTDLFKEWYDQAVENSRINHLQDSQGNNVDLEIYEPYAMVLSTVTTNNRPRSRVVLLREVTSTGLVFYTNYRSDKGKEMEATPWVSANFFWSPLDRQVRIEGRVEKTSPEQSQNYFNSRPIKSRIAAAASEQSEVLPHREKLIETFERYSQPPSRPEHWGGYILIPDYFEFWLGRRNRLHERLAYRLVQSRESEASWEKYLLYP